MDEEKLVELWQALLDEMKGWGDSVPMPVKTRNDDGSVNWKNAADLLFSKKHAKWRENNDVEGLKSDFGIETGIKAAEIGAMVAKLGHAARQIKDANSINTKPPKYPGAPRRNRNLQLAIARANRTASEGTTPQEEALGRAEDDLTYRKGKQDAISLSGGQSGQAAGAIQNLAYQRNLQKMRRANFRNRRKMIGQQQMTGLIGQQLTEDRAIQQHGIGRFNQRDIPLWRQRVNEKATLGLQGRTNLWNGIDAALGLGGNIAGRFLSGSQNNYAYPATQPPVDPSVTDPNRYGPEIVDDYLNNEPYNQTREDKGYQGGFY